MIARVLAWCVVLVICGAVYQWGSKWQSPWKLPSAGSPVLTMLPKASDGCGENCK